MQITFSGRLGGGKSTVCAILRDTYGYEIYSTGTVQRRVAEEMGITTLELNQRMRNDPALDHVIDDAVVKISKERAQDKIVYDSRMAWHFAENTFKVYMYVDPTVAAKRVFAADRGDVEKYASVEDARDQLIARTMEENQRFKRIYLVDNLDYNNYDLIIDSTSATPEQISEAIIQGLDAYIQEPSKRPVLKISPYAIFPTKKLGTDDGEDITVTVKDGFHYCVGGHSKLAALQLGGASFAEAKYLANESVDFDSTIIDEYEAAGGFKYESRGL